MPQFSTKINIGSIMIFKIAPSDIDAIEIAGLPSARMTAFIMFISMNAGKKQSTMAKYSIAIPIVWSDAPNNRSGGSFHTAQSASMITLSISVIVMPVPIQWCAFWVSFFLDKC